VNEDLFPNPLVVLYADDAGRMLRQLELLGAILGRAQLSAAQLAIAVGEPAGTGTAARLASEVEASCAELRRQLEQGLEQG
jgi:hypothetical protein